MCEIIPPIVKVLLHCVRVAQHHHGELIFDTGRHVSEIQV